MNLALHLSKRLKVLRGKKSQAEFAKEIGITKSTLQAIEAQKLAVRLDTLEVICDGLGISVEALLSDMPVLSRFDATAALLQQLDWYTSLPAENRQAIVEWFSQTADLLSTISANLEKK